jgi:hypothetical protein
VARNIDSGEETHPMGEHPLGLIMYAPDGFTSAQLSTANRSPFKGNDPYNGTPDEYTETASSYLAYSGPFHVNERYQLLTVGRDGRRSAATRNGHTDDLSQRPHHGHACVEARSAERLTPPITVYGHARTYAGLAVALPSPY